jgi:type VI secretion system secreted protein Hcp
MAQADFLLDIDGIEGESDDDAHKNKIQLSSFGMGVSNSGSGGWGSGSGASKSNVQDLHFTKLVDKSSPNLFQACCTGKHFDNATLWVRKAGGDKPVEYLVYKLDQVFVTSHNISGHDGGGIAQETGSLNFSKIEMTYSPQAESGGGEGDNTKGYDIASNKPF